MVQIETKFQPPVFSKSTIFKLLDAMERHEINHVMGLWSDSYKVMEGRNLYEENRQ